MHIALLPSAELSYESGSIINALMLFTNFFQSKMHRVSVLAYDLPKKPVDGLAENTHLDKRIVKHPVITDRVVSDTELANSYAATYEFLTKVHDDEQLSIIYVQYFSITSLAAANFGSCFNIPVIVSAFGRDINIGYIKDARYRRFTDMTATLIQGVICPDSTIKDKVSALLSRNGSKAEISVIPPPIDARVFSTVSDNRKAPRNYLLSINSSFSEEKGICTILSAFSDVVSVCPDIKLYIAGDDDCVDQPHLTRIRSLIEELKIGDNVVLTGFVSRAQVGQLLKNALIFIDARTSGNFSSVLLEAQFFHCPTVCTKTEASKKIVSNNVNGVLFDAGDYPALASAVKDLILNKEKRNILSNGAKDWRNKEGDYYLETAAMKEIISFLLKIKGERK